MSSSGLHTSSDPVGQTGRGDPRPGQVDRMRVAVHPHDRASWVGPGELDHADAGAAGRVDHPAPPLQLGDQTGHPGQARGHQTACRTASPCRTTSAIHSGLVSFHHIRAARPQIRLGPSEHLGGLGHLEHAADECGRAVVQQQAGHVRRHPEAGTVPAEYAGRHRGADTTPRRRTRRSPAPAPPRWMCCRVPARTVPSAPAGRPSRWSGARRTRRCVPAGATPARATSAFRCGVRRSGS